MTEPSRPRPVPGPPRPGPWSGPAPVPAGTGSAAAGTTPATTEAAPTGDGTPFADLDQRTVAEHVAVFEAEHARLQRELATIDQL
ncbi:hypothetical protein [Geodermatophilus sp. DF01-2]|uniref:hypothetical protein n=1 Tax=Geodermatophilus sp. DF01-2 TaxID=2559610 RepID=UPI00143061AD|nr:hypothetical protein [Geodermatophilus sp. DF01_2]